jgi:hypothetical protein
VNIELFDPTEGRLSKVNSETYKKADMKIKFASNLLHKTKEDIECSLKSLKEIKEPFNNFDAKPIPKQEELFSYSPEPNMVLERLCLNSLVETF